MNNNLLNNNPLLFDNNLTYYCILIGCGIIIGCTLYYFTTSNNTPIPATSENIGTLTNEEMEAIINENAVFVRNSANIDAISDSDSDTDVASDFQTMFDSDTTSDTESILNDPDLFFMPNVDFDVCPIEELKFFEFTSLYQTEIIEHSISDEEIMEFIS
jgi:hypothetical protein